jgi:lipopolysaccharide export system protein LptA
MNSEIPSTDYSPASADERWIDAALSEHARLGNDGADEELILRILTGTVHRPSRSTAVARAHRDRRSLVIAAVSVAALVALTLVTLSNFSVDAPSRRSDELRFVVRIAEMPGQPAERAQSPLPRVAAKAHAGPVELLSPTPSVPGAIANLDPANLELVTEFGPTFASLPRRTVRDESLRITADRGRTTSDAVTYEGDVIVEHALFRIEAASVRVPVAGDASSDAGAPLQARQVRVVQPGIDCVAEAETLKFDPVAGTLVLTGVSRVETERGELARFSPGDQLVLSGKGFSVETAPVERYADPGLLKR